MTTTTKTTKISNPSIALQRELLGNVQDINNVLTSSENVSPLFHGHYFNMENGKHGIETLITEILTENESILPSAINTGAKAHYEHNALRQVAIASSMFTCDIINEVQSRFSNGSNRYPYTTIHQYLSIFMFRSGKVGKIKLSNSEDKNRPCFKPRVKWFLIG
jgi:hypothetical protein